MEFSKKWLICSALVSLALIIACAAGADLTEITLAVLAETTASSGFYLWKAKNENRAKYAQKYMDKWAEKYGPEAHRRDRAKGLKGVYIWKTSSNVSGIC